MGTSSPLQTFRTVVTVYLPCPQHKLQARSRESECLHAQYLESRLLAPSSCSSQHPHQLPPLFAETPELGPPPPRTENCRITGKHDAFPQLSPSSHTSPSHLTHTPASLTACPLCSPLYPTPPPQAPSLSLTFSRKPLWCRGPQGQQVERLPWRQTSFKPETMRHLQGQPPPPPSRARETSERGGVGGTGVDASQEGRVCDTAAAWNRLRPNGSDVENQRPPPSHL